MNFLKRLLPTYTPPAIARAGGLMILRERILHGTLLSFIPLGLLLILDFLKNASLPNYSIFLAAYIAAYLLVLVMTLARHMPYAIRGHVMVNVIYLLAWVYVLQNGQLGDTRVFLLGYMTLTAVLFKTANILMAMVLSLGLVIFHAYTHPGSDWILPSLSFFSLVCILVGSIELVVNGLNDNLKSQAQLSQNLEKERDMLENRVQERTDIMSRRIVQLRTSADISRTISTLSDPEGLIQQVADLVKDRFKLYYVGIFLLDTARQFAVLRAGTGEPGKRMLASGHQLAVGGSSMIGWSVANRKARIALDVGEEAVRFNNPNLPLTRSELALPIIAHDMVLGAITIQSDQHNAFDENDISILQSIADSLAIALENDRLYHETRQRLEEIRALNREYLQQAWAETIDIYGELSYAYETPNVSAEPQTMKSIQVPLLLRDEAIGSIILEMDRDTLSEDETAFIENVTTQTAIALENARLLHETEQRAVQEQKLNELASRFSRALSIEEIIRSAAQELGQLPTVAEVSVQINPVAAPTRPSSGPTGMISGANGKERGA